MSELICTVVHASTAIGQDDLGRCSKHSIEAVGTTYLAGHYTDMTVGVRDLLIGTAGWSVHSSQAAAFPQEGSALERYASRFSAVEINSSFHRAHRPATWAKWAALVPGDFRFSVKVPKAITHARALADCDLLLREFLDGARELGRKLAVLLVQLPPKLAFDAAVAAKFFEAAQVLTSARLVCEPRHPSWFEADADAFLRDVEVARVAADPSPVTSAAQPGGWRGMSYWRLHGSPAIYRSPYGRERLADYARSLTADAARGETWCIFDNTASSAAISDALLLDRMLRD